MIAFECPNCGSRACTADGETLVCKSCGNFYTEEMLREIERHKEQMAELRRMEEARRLRKATDDRSASERMDGMIQYVREMLAHRNFERAEDTLRKLQETNVGHPIVRVLYTRYLLQKGKFSDATEIIDNWEKAAAHLHGKAGELLREFLAVYDGDLWGCFDSVKREAAEGHNGSIQTLACTLMMLLAPFREKNDLSFLQRQSEKLKSIRDWETFMFDLLGWAIFVASKRLPIPSEMDDLMQMCAHLPMRRDLKTEIYERYLLATAGVFDLQATREDRRKIILAFRDGVLSLMVGADPNARWTDRHERIYALLQDCDKSFEREQETLARKWRGDSQERPSEARIEALTMIKTLASEMGIPHGNQPAAFFYAMAKKKDQSMMPSRWKIQYQPRLDKVFELWPECRELLTTAQKMWDEDRENIRKLQAESAEIWEEARAWGDGIRALKLEREDVERRLHALQRETGFSLVRGGYIAECEAEIQKIDAKLEEQEALQQKYAERLAEREMKVKFLENKLELFLQSKASQTE